MSSTAVKSEARDLDADLAICEAATPGAWETDTFSIFTAMRPDFTGGLTVASLRGMWKVSNPKHENDCEFIAAARTGWPYAILRAKDAEKENDRLRTELEMLQEQLQQHRSHCFD
jgi:hypothetical protein